MDQRSHVPAKIENDFLDACSIRIGKVQSSLFVVFLRPALSLKELFLLSDTVWKNCAFFLVNCVHHFAEGTPQNNGWTYHFRKSATYAKGLHFGIKCHYLKIILYLTQRGCIIWRTKKMFYTFFKKYHTPLIKGPLIKGPVYTQKNPILKFEMRVSCSREYCTFSKEMMHFPEGTYSR